MSPPASNPRSAIQFINGYPQEAKESASKRRATIRSHAARATHAKARQARVREYQAGQLAAAHVPQHQPETRSIEGEYLGTDEHHDQPITNVIERVAEDGIVGYRMLGTVASPLLAAPNSGGNDPFMSFVAPFTRTEHFLFSHCE